MQEQQLAVVLNQLKDRVEQLLMLLSDKERFVIERRFCLNTERRLTLEEIGQEFNVTRERVRQIEKNALQKLKRNVDNYDVITINNMADVLIREHGGLIDEEGLISKLLLQDVSATFAEIQFILSLDKRFKRIPNTIKYRPYLRLVQFSDVLIDEVAVKSVNYLKKKGQVEKVEVLAREVSKLLSMPGINDPAFYNSLFKVNKEFKLVGDSVGLIDWRHINPRTLRDKIFYVLRNKKQPMHFVEIGNAIVAANFDRKSLNMQAVHNELIRHNDFVLIGRGIYALKEWGYSHGTVAEVIADILKEKEFLSEDQIIAEVLKRRKVKPITIILNLKNKKYFTRVGRKQYALKQI